MNSNELVGVDEAQAGTNLIAVGSDAAVYIGLHLESQALSLQSNQQSVVASVQPAPGVSGPSGMS